MQSDDERVFELLEHLDHAPPNLSAADVMRAAQPTRTSLWRRAAVIVVGAGLVGVAAYAVPGSPVRGWFKPHVDTDVVSAAATQHIDAAGVMIPANEPVIIEFRVSAPESVLQIRLGEGDNVAVRTPDRAVTFTSDADRLLVDNSSAPTASYSIDIPRTAAYVEILVSGKRVFVKDAARTQLPVTIPLS